MRENLLTNIEIQIPVLHWEDINELAKDLLLNEVIDPVLPPLFLLIQAALLDYLG